MFDWRLGLAGRQTKRNEGLDMGWKITDWEKLEIPERKDRDCTGPLDYWKCPVTQNRRYKLLIGQPKGWQWLGIWHALVASWGRQTRTSRQGGVFRTSEAGDRPASLEDLAADTLVPVKLLKEAIVKFLSSGWLSELATNWQPIGNQMAGSGDTRLDKTRLDKTILTPKLRFGGNENELGLVELTPEQHDKLEIKWGAAELSERLTAAHNYFQQIGPQATAKRYKSHYHTLLNWDRMEKKRAQQNRPALKETSSDRMQREAREARRKYEATKKPQV